MIPMDFPAIRENAICFISTIHIGHFWGPMHWGHVISRDLLHWTYQPAVLAPDQPYDNGNGCFSGSAQTLDDGRQILLYTGVSWEKQSDGSMKEIQQQCIASGDGEVYEK